MENFYKLISILTLASTTVVAQAETKFQGTFGFKSDHIRRAQVIGNDGAYYGNLNFSKAGLSFSATALKSMGGVDAAAAEGIITYPDDLTEEQFEIGYSASIGQFNFDLKMLDRTSDADVPGGLTAEVEERENSISFDVGAFDYTYVDGEISIEAEGDGELGYNAYSIGYNVSNVNFLLGRMRYDSQGAGYDYYEIKTATEMFGLDVSVVLTGVIGIDNLDDEFDPKDRLILGFSKSIDL